MAGTKGFEPLNEIRHSVSVLAGRRVQPNSTTYPFIKYLVCRLIIQKEKKNRIKSDTLKTW